MKEVIRKEIQRVVSATEDERGSQTIWRRPLVGFASAADPLFATLKSVVSPTHAMPADLIDQAVTVVAFFLPFTKTLAASNRKGDLASKEWALAYLQTNQLIHDISLHMKTLLEGHGFPTRIIPATHNFDPEKLISDWSHRHVAFIAGLGRFGVNNMLITDSGCCGRVGSFITSAPAEPDPHCSTERCLFRHDETCLRCVDRCVNEALRVDGFDRHRCYEMCLMNEERFEAMANADVCGADVCGKCVVGIPCSLTDPVKAKRNKKKSRPGGD